MTSVTTKTLSYITASQFKESFYEFSPTIGYLFIGNHLKYVDENNPPNITDTIDTQKTISDNLFCRKHIIPYGFLP